MKSLFSVFILAAALLTNFNVLACKDAVVLVHGNASSPSSWDNTVSQLLANGYSAQEVFRPNWGSKTCAACNNHSGYEETPVRNALIAALSQSCTGNIDVIGHSMGVTLAIQQIQKLNIANNVDTFVGIAGALRGLRTCGTYPFNIPSSTCGRNGLSINSPFLSGIFGGQIGAKVYSIKSNFDQIICATGTCNVGGVHSSRIWNEMASFTYSLGHFGLQSNTSNAQVTLIQ